MKILYILVLCLAAACHTPPATKKDLHSVPASSSETVKNDHCFFWGSQLSNGSRVIISKDMFIVFSDGILRKTWFNRESQRYDTTLVESQAIDQALNVQGIAFDL